MLLLSLTAVRTGRPFESPGYLGVSLGIVGNLILIPAVAEPMFMIFGPGMMIWSAYVGIVMLRPSESSYQNLIDDKRKGTI